MEPAALRSPVRFYPIMITSADQTPLSTRRFCFITLGLTVGYADAELGPRRQRDPGSTCSPIPRPTNLQTDVNVNGTRLFADIRGPEDGPPMLFVHGGPGQSCYDFMHAQGTLLGIESWTILGHSAGGGYALSYALQHAGRLREGRDGVRGGALPAAVAMPVASPERTRDFVLRSAAMGFR